MISITWLPSIIGASFISGYFSAGLALWLIERRLRRPR